MFLNQPNSELQCLIRRELNEDVNTRDRDLETVKNWLNKQPHLPKSMDDRRLLSFLRGCSFSLEKCKKKLDMYYTMRAALPEFFTNRDITRPEMKELLDYGYAIYLPTLTTDGKRIAVTGTTRTDFETPDIADFFKYVFMLNDVRLVAEQFGVAGDIYVLDATVALPKHFLRISPTAIKKFLICAQQAYPIKIKEVHIVNVTPFAEFIVNTFKPFLKEKIRNRIHLHQDMNSLHRQVPKELLPEEFGGDAGKLKDLQDVWLKKLEEDASWFKEQESIMADESLRSEDRTNYENLFGLDGSFKQLNID